MQAPLDATFEALPAAAPLLALKDYVFLACSALGKLRTSCSLHNLDRLL